MTPSLLRMIHAQLNHNDPIDAIFWGICLYAFLLLFRKSNLVPTKVDGFNCRQQLRHADCVMDPMGKKVTVGVRVLMLSVGRADMLNGEDMVWVLERL